MQSQISHPPPVVWTIAGSDSGAGAGIQADLKTFSGLGVYGCTVITAITAQNTCGIERVEAVSVEMVRAQLRALAADLPPRLIKTGMLGSAAVVEAVAATLDALRVPVVCDPVVRSTSGAGLVDEAGLHMIREHVAPHICVLTPNVPEAALLAKQSIRNHAEMESAAHALCGAWGRSILIKGGHLEGDPVRDYWTDGTRARWFESSRLHTRHTHGTGCTLASALTAALAQGHDMESAIELARAYVRQGLETAPGIGRGHGPLQHGGWPLSLR
jgi:hydroxymethylpyrimidine kinase/phosphomethylpyrimidine kinase